jgi:hypothetical protein
MEICVAENSVFLMGYAVLPIGSVTKLSHYSGLFWILFCIFGVSVFVTDGLVLCLQFFVWFFGEYGF